MQIFSKKFSKKFSFGKSLYYVCLTPFDIQAHIITYSSVQSFILYLLF